MKKCPTCEKTFDDNMRFCQADGTPLVEDTPAVDPYKTMVAKSDDLPIPGESDPGGAKVGDAEKVEESIPSEPAQSAGAPKEGDVSPTASDQSPEAAEPAGQTDQPQVPSESATPEPPKFSEPELSPPGDMGEESPAPADQSVAAETAGPASGESEPSEPPPPSPFDEPAEVSEQQAAPESPAEAEPKPSSPIPSPFESSMPGYEPPTTPMPPYKEAEAKAEALNTPFAEEVADDQALDQAWNPPGGAMEPAFGQDAPMRPQAPGIEGENQTLAIVSLVLGILSIPCCGFVVFGVAAAITGFLAKKNAEENPTEYGGRGMALAGMIIGIITAVVGLLLTILQIAFGVLGSL